MITVLTNPPAKPATMPSVAPMMKAIGTGVTPMTRDSRAPWMRRESMSRPSSSPPSGKPGVPMGRSRRSIEPFAGSAGAKYGANTAISTSATITASATIATGSRDSRLTTPLQ